MDAILPLFTPLANSIFTVPFYFFNFLNSHSFSPTKTGVSRSPAPRPLHVPRVVALSLGSLHTGWAKVNVQLWVCETRSLLLCYYLLVIVLFSISTTIDLLRPTLYNLYANGSQVFVSSFDLFPAFQIQPNFYSEKIWFEKNLIFFHSCTLVHTIGLAAQLEFSKCLLTGSCIHKYHFWKWRYCF